MAAGAALLAGRYELRHVLGAGPAGKVWSAFDFETGVRVAVKTFHAHLASDPVFRARVVQAAQDSAGVEHGNLVAVRGAGDDGRFVVMDLVRGVSMRSLLDGHGPPSAEVAVELVYDACAALAAAHEHGVLHGNLKPENLLVVSGSVRVTDLALPAVGDAGGALVRYQAPEVARTGAGDARSDLYALGCCLYELVVGRPPFDGPTARDVAARHAAEPPALPSAVGIGLPAALEDVIERALAKAPDQRYQSARELRESLEQVSLRLGAWHHATPADTLEYAPAAPAARPAPSPARPPSPPAPAEPSRTPVGEEPFTPVPAGPFAPAPPAPLRVPVSPLVLMEADAGSRPAPQPVAAGGVGPAAPITSRRARAAAQRDRDAVPMGVRIITAVIVFGLLTGVMTGTVAATGTAGALQSLVSPLATAGAAPQADPAPAPEAAGQPQEVAVPAGPASVEELIAMIDAVAVGPRGPEFRERLTALPTLSGEALRLELSFLRSIAAIGPANGDFTPEFSQAAVRVLDQELAAQAQPEAQPQA